MGERFKPVVVGISAIINDGGAGGESQLASHTDLVGFAIREDREAGQVTVMVQQQMQLDRDIGAAELRPIVEFQAEINDAGIHTDQLVLESEFRLPRTGLRLAALQQLEKDSLIKFPGAVLVSIGQGRFRRSLTQPQMFQFAFGGRQSLRDLTQAVGPPQLAEQHSDELAPAGEASCMSLGFVLMHRRLELDAGKQLENLAKNTAY